MMQVKSTRDLQKAVGQEYCCIITTLIFVSATYRCPLLFASQLYYARITAKVLQPCGVFVTNPGIMFHLAMLSLAAAYDGAFFFY